MSYIDDRFQLLDDDDEVLEGLPTSVTATSATTSHAWKG